jgi:hypothetical protein
MKLSLLHFYLSMPNQKFEEKRDSIQNRLFAHEGCLFPLRNLRKRPESSLYTKNRHFTLKGFFLLKYYRYICSEKSCIYQHCILKKLISIKLAKIIT